MAHSALLATPVEVLLLIVEAIPDLTWNRAPNYIVRKPVFHNKQVLSLSQVIRILRRVCLPTLYSHLTLREGRSDENLLSRTPMRNNPGLAALVRSVDISCSQFAYRPDLRCNCCFSSVSLSYLPNLERLCFPSCISLDLELLTDINSHPNLRMARWPTTPSLLLPPLSELPPRALSRISVEAEQYSDWDAPLWSDYFALGLRLNVLVMNKPPVSESFDSRFLNIHEIRIMAPCRMLDRLEWFGGFWDRYPHILRVTISWWLIALRGTWDVLKNVPPIGLLYDAAHRQGLTSSFHVVHFVGNRSQSPLHLLDSYSLDLHICRPDVTLDVLQLVGSVMPAIHLTIHFNPPLAPPCLCSTIAFVSAMQQYHQTAVTLRMTDAHRMFDLDTISVHKHYYEVVARFKTSGLHDHALKQASQLAQMAHDLVAGIPRLEVVEFSNWSTPIGYFNPQWKFERSRDRRGSTLEVSYFPGGIPPIREVMEMCGGRFAWVYQLVA